MCLPFRVLLIFAMVLGSSSVWAGGKKGDVRVSFHIETESSDNPKMIFPHQVFEKQRFFRRIPEIATKDIVDYSPFPADDQRSYGAIFRLKGPAQRRLAAVTSVNVGRWMICQSFGRIVDGVLVDAAINDGKIVIWKGLSLLEIKELDKMFDRIGDKEREERKKQKKRQKS